MFQTKTISAVLMLLPLMSVVPTAWIVKTYSISPIIWLPTWCVLAFVAVYCGHRMINRSLYKMIKDARS